MQRSLFVVRVTEGPDEKGQRKNEIPPKKWSRARHPRCKMQAFTWKKKHLSIIFHYIRKGHCLGHMQNSFQTFFFFKLTPIAFIVDSLSHFSSHSSCFQLSCDVVHVVSGTRLPHTTLHLLSSLTLLSFVSLSSISLSSRLP